MEMAQPAINDGRHAVELRGVDPAELSQSLQLRARIVEQVGVIQLEQIDVWTLPQKIENAIPVFA